ncbi:MAG: hypothetical protein Kow0075_06390 [Salibacteraceae bacterium]
MMEEVYDYTPEELKKLGDAIVWTCILAAVHQDGVIHESEKAEAIKQTHIRSFTAPDYLKPIYKHLDQHFERDFEAYSALLPEDHEQREEFIQTKLQEALSILPSIGPLFTKRFSKDLKDIYNRVFRADSNVFQYFAFPIISAHLEKFGL